MCIVSIREWGGITPKGSIDELHIYQTQRGKSKVNISLCQRKNYKSTDLEEIWSRFIQIKPGVSHIELHIPEKPLTPKNIREALKGTQWKFWKEALFVKYDNNIKVNLLLDTIAIKYFPDGKKVLPSIIYPGMCVFSGIRYV